MDIATKLVGMYCQVASVPHKDEGSQLTATSAEPTNLSQSTIPLKTAKDAVVDAMRLQFYKIYGPIYEKTVIGGSSLPT
jgi:hypothetical protein